MRPTKINRLALRLIGITLCLCLIGGAGLATAQEELPVLAAAAVSANGFPGSIRDYINAIALLDIAGANGSITTKSWKELEPQPTQYALQTVQDELNFYTRIYDKTEFLGIQPLNTVPREVPTDLASVPFDDPQMIARFNALYDQLAPLMTQNVRYVSIGNEVDVYLENHPDEWEPYRLFFEATAAHVREVTPWVQVGTTVTFGGMRHHPDEIAALTAQADVAIITYYPLSDSAQVASPDAPLRDFPEMIERAGSKPVVLQEFGYPSSPVNGSSDSMQAEFVDYVFEAWQANQAHIPYLSYFALHDFTDDTCDMLLQYYGLNADVFRAFLCTLGLRYANGEPKPAWTRFEEHARAFRTGGD